MYSTTHRHFNVTVDPDGDDRGRGEDVLKLGQAGPMSRQHPSEVRPSGGRVAQAMKEDERTPGGGIRQRRHGNGNNCRNSEETSDAEQQ